MAEPAHSTKAAKEATAKADLDAAVAGLKAQISDFGKTNKTAKAGFEKSLAHDKAVGEAFVHELAEKASKPSMPIEMSFEKPDGLGKPEEAKELFDEWVQAKLNETKADVAGLKKDLNGPVVINVTTYDITGMKEAVWSGLKNVTSKPGKDFIDGLAAAKDELKAEKAAGKAGEHAADTRLDAAKEALKARLVDKVANLTKHH